MLYYYIFIENGDVTHLWNQGEMCKTSYWRNRSHAGSTVTVGTTDEGCCGGQVNL